MTDYEKTARAASGVKQDVPYDDIEHTRGARRRSSVISAIKENYGIVHEGSGSDTSSIKAGQDYTHRKLKPRHIQLIGIGGTIGTALYVNIGRGVLNGGPASLFMAFTIWCGVIMMVTNCMSEMVTYLPISSPFIRFAGRWVDDAFGFAAGYNFFVFEAALVPFEIVACNVIIKFWTDAMPAGATIAIILVLYALVNMFAVKWYGETEFWMALGKVLLIIGLLFYTFFVMLGVNPLGDRFGFRYWKNPGSFATYGGYEGDVGRFVGFLSCLIQASFTIAGPDYVSMAAGETEDPRHVLPRAFKAVFYRLTTFFVLGSLAVGILVPYDDEILIAAYEAGAPGAAASPYVASMIRLRISVLPHIVNAMVLTSALSAGNSYVYCASRSLYGMALDGKAPKFMKKCTKNGVPIWCVTATLIIALLSFLQLSNDAAIVLQWFVNLVTASQLINFCVMCYTYLKFRKALAAQGISRDSLPHKAFWQPYATYFALVACFIMTFVGGYSVFLPGNWDVPTFLFSYTMIGVFPLLYVVWKFTHKTKWLKPEEADLKTDLAEVEEYQRNYVATPARNWVDKWFNKIFS